MVEATGDARPIVWVNLKPGERLARAVDRREGVDLLVGGSPSEFAQLSDSGQLVSVDPLANAPWRSFLWETTKSPRSFGSNVFGDPRDDPGSFSRAKVVLDREGWPKGYEELVRLASVARPGFERPSSFVRWEGIAVVKGGRNPAQCREILKALEDRKLIEAPAADAMVSATADGLLADLLGAALVDAHEELRDAEAALRRFGHPARAEASIGERPPWPPASVVKLREGSTGLALIETLAEQLAPDPTSRAWLKESWSRPKRQIDGGLLVELAGAADGRLAREPRFRAWLRGEWTAWSRQLYRRVARVAGGYVPS